MEFQLRDRQSFREFVGAYTNARIPDVQTLCFFRNNLAQVQAFESLFHTVLDQIEASGFIAQEGQIVDSRHKRVRRIVVTKAKTHDSQFFLWDEQNTKKIFYWPKGR